MNGITKQRSVQTCCHAKKTFMKRGIGVLLSAALFFGPGCKKTAKPLAETASLGGDSAAVYVVGGLFV